MDMPTLTLIAGANGSGKSTFVRAIALPSIDPDRIAASYGEGFTPAAPLAASSIFFAFRVEDRVLWRVYPLVGETAPLTSKREVYRLIEAGREVPRTAYPSGPDGAPYEVFPYLERAVGDLLAESAKSVKKSKFKLPLKGHNLTLSTWLQDTAVQALLDPQRRERLLYTLEERSLSGFERDPALKVLLACIGHAKPAELAADIEAFLVDNKLLLEVPGVRATAQQITRAQISLIAYEWLT